MLLQTSTQTGATKPTNKEETFKAHFTSSSSSAQLKEVSDQRARDRLNKGQRIAMSSLVSLPLDVIETNDQQQTMNDHRTLTSKSNVPIGIYDVRISKPSLKFHIGFVPSELEELASLFISYAMTLSAIVTGIAFLTI
jgi:hypothetical protein